jgi:hypothetical protein
MRTLIYGGACIQTEFQQEQTLLWAKVVRKLNPDEDVVLFDSASVFRPQIFIPSDLGIKHVRWEDNPGHLSQGGGDGAGRTFCAGIKMAAGAGHKWAVHWGTDFLMAKPVVEITHDMEEARVRIAALPCIYQFPEFEFAAIDALWAEGFGFTEKYDWPSIKGPYPKVERPSQLRKFLPEYRLRDIAGGNLFLLPLSGIRNDQNQVNVANLHEHFPYMPPQWLHMWSDVHLAHRFLELNGITLP